MIAIPNYADVIPLEEFVAAVKSGFFTDDDGTGYYANPPMMEEHTEALDCYEIYKDRIKSGFTHVAWFNK